ncbi:peptidase family M1-domain-containing protein, partial [Ochromonadaceae sp. CCMP2298]
MPEVSSTHVSSKEGGGKEGDGSLWKRVVFDKSPKMSTYLLAWAIGEFDFVQAATKGGVAIRVYSPPGRGPQGQFALDVAVRSLDFYDDFFKTPYPLPKLDMICITEFAAGAMENWGLVTYRETALMVDEATASPQQKQRVAIVVAHELAHQWFGNLVTMAWWDGLWLNEGFAAFMEHFCIDALFPEYKMWEQYTTDGFSAALRLDALKSSHPVIVPIRHAEEVEQVFDAISYCKGSAVVNMVSAFLGPQQFQAGLQAYMARHAYGNTETGDLWAAWSQASGMDVASLMRTWTTVMGYPYLKVVSEKWREGEVEVTLEQGRFLSDGSAEEGGEGGGALWSIPLLFSTAGTVSQEAVLMDQKQQTFIVPVAASAAGALPWLKINAGQKALVRVAHSTEMVARLQGSIAEVAPVDRAALLLDAYALAKAGLAPLESVVTILRALAGDEESIVWSAIAGVLGGLHMLMEQVSAEGSSSATFQQFEAFGKHIVVQALAKVGWESVSGESHTHKLMRASVMGLLDSFAWSDPLVAAEAKSRFDRHWEDPQALPAEYKTAVYRIVLMNGGLAEYESVLAEFNGTEDNQVRKYPMFTLGATQDQALKMRTLEWAVKSGAVKLQDTFYPIGSVAGDLRGAHMAWKYFQE